MNVVEYLGYYWLQQDLNSINTELNYLVNTNGNRYVEIKEYFLKVYGIAVKYTTIKHINDCTKLQLTLENKEIDVKTLFEIDENIICGCTSDYNEETGYTYYTVYILIDINQTIENL